MRFSPEAGLNKNFSKTQSILKENIQSIMTDIHTEQVNKWSQNRLYVEKIADFEINFKHDLCSGKVENKNVKIFDTNKNLENKYANKHLQDKSNSEVKNIVKREKTLLLKQKSIIAEERWFNEICIWIILTIF